MFLGGCADGSCARMSGSGKRRGARRCPKGYKKRCVKHRGGKKKVAAAAKKLVTAIKQEVK